jgi:hypothetical protein
MLAWDVLQVVGLSLLAMSLLLVVPAMQELVVVLVVALLRFSPSVRPTCLSGLIAS